MSAKDFLPDSEVIAKILPMLERVNPESRERVFQVIGAYFGFSNSQVGAKLSQSTGGQTTSAVARFTEDRSLSPKEFLLQKNPKTDIERVACLAYYLTHYRDTPHFKTVDISRLNTDAAQIKFSNPGFAVTNATNTNYLTQAGKGTKQITALGERFVEALPDREAAKASMEGARRVRTSKKKKK